MNSLVKKFEVPYNFDSSLVDFYTRYRSIISFIYLPPFKADAINARTLIENPNKGAIGYMPDTRDEYIEHLIYIQQKGLECYILWQDNKSIEPENIRFYQNFGVNGFVVGNEQNASIIKTVDKNLRLIASITMKLTFNDLLYRDFSYFDGIVLFFPFTRSLNAIKKLSHIKEKLVLMPNTICYTDCAAIHHWFPKNNELRPEDRCMAWDNIDKCCLIYPEHLCMFDDYVGGYKLQGRDYPTFEIIKNAEAYFYRSSSNNFLDSYIDEQLKKLISEQGLLAYYNIKSNEITASTK